MSDIFLGEQHGLYTFLSDFCITSAYGDSGSINPRPHSPLQKFARYLAGEIIQSPHPKSLQ